MKYLNLIAVILFFNVAYAKEENLSLLVTCDSDELVPYVAKYINGKDFALNVKGKSPQEVSSLRDNLKYMAKTSEKVQRLDKEISTMGPENVKSVKKLHSIDLNREMLNNFLQSKKITLSEFAYDVSMSFSGACDLIVPSRLAQLYGTSSEVKDPILKNKHLKQTISDLYNEFLAFQAKPRCEVVSASRSGEIDETPNTLLPPTLDKRVRAAIKE